MEAKFYLVGGALRDTLLGKTPKDIDYVVDVKSMDEMEAAIVARGGEVFKDKEGNHVGGKFLTMRGKLPGIGAADFVLPRKDGEYHDGRHPESVQLGTLHEDLARRDFTINAMARLEETNEIIDLFGGQEDLAQMKLRCVGDTRKRLSEDALRILRAIRFQITKGFSMDDSLFEYIETKDAADSLAKISIERIREELTKCFEFDTRMTLCVLLDHFPLIGNHVFSRNLKLVPTIQALKT